MPSSRQGRSQQFRSILGVTMVLVAMAAMRPDVTHAWPANATNCTANMVLTAGATLSFGAIIGSVPGGTVIVSTSSGIIASGVTAAGGTVTAASFTGTDPGINANPSTGCTNRTITVTVGTATLTGPGTSMTVNVMTDSVTESALGTWDYRTVPINVGGTLNVNGNQATGSYSGTFSITIVYQ